MRKQEVSQLSVVFLLSALHFNPYAEIELWKVWLLPHTNKMFRARQNRENWQPAHKPNVWSVRPAKTDYRRRSIHKKIRTKVVVSHVWNFLASLAGFPPKEGSWSETAVSSTLHDRVLLCNRRTHYLLLFPLPACCFTLSASCTQGVTRGWHCCLTTASLTL